MDNADSSDDEDNLAYSHMILPTLTDQLKIVLEQYPDNGQIIKELIQNAEDAGASVVKMCIEPQDINRNVVRPSRICQHLQGPALCVYNDAIFTKEDWDGIKMLQCSIKKDDPLKIGHFGLGFKTVFHLTDYPCIISGSRMLFIDPHQPEDRVNADLNLNNLSSKLQTEVLAAFEDTLGFTKSTLLTGFYNGTLFWFPLRQMSSNLSGNLYDVAKLQSLFKSFETESALSLIFLMSVGSIECYMKDNSLMKPLFLSKLTESCQPKKMYQTFLQEIDKVPAHHLPQIPVSTVFKIKIVSTTYKEGKICTAKMCTWTVAVYFMGGQASSCMQHLLIDTRLNYSPLVGIALCNDPSQLCQRNSALSGHVFCFLPLPLQSKSLTGLPVHVNGFFALSHERQHLKWTLDGEDISGDRYIQWNRCLIEEVVPKAYNMLILNMIEESKARDNDEQSVSAVYDCIPNASKVDPNWHVLLRPLFSSLLEEDIIFTKADGGQWVNVNDAIICQQEECAANPEMVMVVKTLLAYSKNVALLPSHMRAAFEYCHISTTMVSATLLCDILHTGIQYKTFPNTSKLNLLLFILKHGQPSDLDGLELLPLDDSTFCSFSTSTRTPVFKIASQLSGCFPGLENICLASDLQIPQLTSHICDLVSAGMFQLKEVSPANGKSWIPKLVDASVKSQFGNGRVVPADQKHLEWLSNVWKMLSMIFRDNLKEFEDICLVPKEDGDGGNLYLYKLNCSGMMSSYNMSGDVYSAVEKLGVVAIPKLSEYMNSHPLIQNYVAPSTLEGFISCLGKISETEMKMSGIVNFNSNATSSEKEALLDLLSGYNKLLETNVLSLVQQLQIWKEIMSIKDSEFAFTSFEKNNKVAPVTSILRKFPIPLIWREKEKYTSFLTLVGFTFISENLLAKSLLHNAQTLPVDKRSELQDLIFDLMRDNFHVRDKTILSMMKETKFVPCSTQDDRLLKKASELFTSKDYLQAFFMLQDMTPVDSFAIPEHINFLKILGLKTMKDITATQVLECARHLHQWQMEDAHGDVRNIKAAALLKFLASNSHVLKDHELAMIRRLHCVPCAFERPVEFPKVVEWYGETIGDQLCRPLDLSFSKYNNLVGSFMPVPASSLSIGGLKQLLSNSVPSQNVLQQLTHIAEMYRSSCKGHLLRHIVDIMEHLSRQPYDIVANEIKKNIYMLNKPFMWAGSVFANPAQIFLQQNIDDINLIPYVYPLPDELKNVSDFCRKLGCLEQQTPELWVRVIADVKKHHDASEGFVDRARVTRDLQIVCLILERLQQDPETVAKFQSKLLIPVETEDNMLKLLPMKQCTYCEASWLQSESIGDLREDEVVHIIHPSIRHDTAQKLGVPSLNQTIMADVDTNFYERFGQSESLCKRLRGLLKDYADGLSIFLELIQNADDAGAGVVKFLYDERENKDLSQHLFNGKMKECQGPALWAYNNAVFTETDFLSIIDLGGATKQNDNTKIGKFGIGFNAVYNLTDVPSFVSGYKIAFFDPRRKYLGNSIEGLKIDTRSLKNRFVIQNLDHQFKTYDGVFGCRLTSDYSPYEGTLFRFPLRTMTQLSNEDDYICNKAYTKSEVEALFEKFVERAGDILLFTQNVKEIEFHFLPSSAVDAKNTELLLQVTKTIREYPLTDAQRHSPVKTESMVKWAQEMLQSGAAKKKEKHVTRTFHCDIDTTNCEQIQNVFPRLRIHTDFSRTSWFLVWAFGCKKSLSCALKENAKLLPLSAVALPVTIDDVCLPVPLHKLPQGHSKVGHMYCFLPLPVTNEFPVHIQANFAVTRDRKHLCEAISGEKDDHGADWNSALFSDAICSSYVNLLDFLKQVDPRGEYYQVWPTLKPGQSDSLAQAFYQEVQQNSELAIFRGKSDWLPFKDILMLESQFRCIPDIGNRAQKIVENSKLANRIVDVPQRITECFPETYIARKKITTRLFYEHVFLPNMKNESIASDDIDPMMLYALDSRDDGLLTLLQNSQCISTQPKGALNFPKDLVHPYGTISKLFTEEDGRFPLGTLNTYCSAERLNVLTGLGMLKDDISWPELLERAETVATMTNFIAAKERSHLILKQAEKKLGRAETCPDDIREALYRTAFLPLLHKPQKWSFVWAGDEYNPEEFKRPCELYLSCLQPYVSCSKLVVELNGICDVVLKWVGVLADVDRNITVCQLKHYSNSNQEVPVNLVEPVYEKLANIYEEQEDSRDKIKQNLNSFRSICIDGDMVEVRQVSLTLERQCRPFLYQLPYFSRGRITSFFVRIGVKEAFVPDDFIDVLDELHDLQCGEPLETAQLNLVQNVVDMLSASMIASSKSSEAIDKSRIFLPDDKSILCQLSKLCFDDMNAMNISMEMHLLHDGISRNIAESLGITEKRRWHMQTLANSLPFGQSEKLTSRLKRILTGYPCDQEILKELLQNADDAGASEVMFIIDETRYQGRQLFSDEWASLQGPALCVFNNKPFSEKDLVGIQRLGEGGKSDDPSKVGQYGVGFNVVYHVTDVPSFLTKSASGNLKLCILDPHCRYVPGTGVASPGVMFNDVDALYMSYPDSMRCYLAQFFQKHGEGTLFRLPLRTGNAAQISEINAEECKVDDIKQMFSNFTKDLHDCLLFLNNVRKLSLCHVTRGDVDVDDVVELVMTNANVARKEYFQECQKLMLCDYNDNKLSALDSSSFSETSYELKITDHKIDQRSWLVCQRPGLKRHIASEVLKKAIADGKLVALPVGGVAFPMRNQITRPYCFLPLPIQSGIPVSFNGHFALDHEARRNLWHDESNKGSKSVWNNLLIQEVIAPAYVSGLEAVRDKLFPPHCMFPLQRCEKLMDRYHQYFPMHWKAKDDYWRHLVSSVYKQMVNQDVMLFPVISPVVSHEHTDMCEVKWVSLEKNSMPFAYFNTFEEQLRDSFMVDSAKKRQKQLTAVLLRSEISLLASPLSVMRSMISSGVKIQDLGPDVLIKMMKDKPAMFGVLPKALHESKFADADEFGTLLKFCGLSSKLSSELEGLPLLLTEDHTLRIFDSRNPVYLSEYLDLVPGSCQLFACMELLFEYERLAKCSPHLNVCFRDLKIEGLATCLPPNYRTVNDNFLLWTSSDEEQRWWIHRLWLFLYQETRSLSSANEIRNQLDLLTKFCLLPILRSGSVGEQISYLAPLSMVQKVIVLPINSNLGRHISNLDLNILDQEAMNSENICDYEITRHFSQIMARESNPLSCAIVLTFVCHWKDLKLEDFNYLVTYFSQNLHKVEKKLKNKFKRVLQSLPIYRTIAQEHEHLKPDRTVVVEEIESIPFAGMDILSSKTMKTFHNLSKCENDLAELYEYLDVRSITPTEFYTRYVLPNFVSLGGPARLLHLAYIRDELLKFGKESSTDDALKESLQETPFLMQHGKLHTAKTLFAPWIPLFDMFLPPEDFPPIPFLTPEWKLLLTVAGIQTQLTEDLLVTFAELVELESIDNVDITNVLKKSQIIIQVIFEIPIITSALCSRLMDIRFIVEHKMDDQYTEVCPQHMKHNGMLAFNQSVPCDQDLHCWSTCDLLPKWAIPSEMTKETCLQLGIQCRPSPEQIVLHVTNVCLGLSGENPNMNPEREFLNTLMAKLYEGLTMCPDMNFVRHQLENVPMIYIPESYMLTTVQHVVLELSEEYEILAPYLCKVSVQFGPYFCLFEDLGMSARPDINHFAYVLDQLQKEYMSNELIEDAMAQSLMTTKGVFSCLPNDGSSVDMRCEILWFPSRTHQLVKSKDLVIVDDEELFTRTEQLELQCMVGFSEFGCGCFHHQLISSLPDKHRPRLLSSMVQEKITERSLNSIVERHEYVHRISQRLASPAFLDAVVQLMIHQSSLNSIPCLPPDDLKRNFKKCLDHISLVGVSVLETHLLFEGKYVENSVGEKSYHTEIEQDNDDTEFKIYFQDQEKDVYNPVIYLHLTICIGKILTNKRFGHNFNMYLNSLLQAEESQYVDIVKAMQLESTSDLEEHPDSARSSRQAFRFDVQDSVISVRSVQPSANVGSTWLKQAHSDYNAAQGTLNSTTPYHEWICYQLHQSAEKALKALMYYFGSSGDVNILEHNLRCIALFSQEGMRLADTANALETLLVAHTRMRYPHGNRAPCEIYSPRHSAEAIRMTNIILRKVIKLLQPAA